MIREEASLWPHVGTLKQIAFCPLLPETFSSLRKGLQRLFPFPRSRNRGTEVTQTPCVWKLLATSLPTGVLLGGSFFFSGFTKEESKDERGHLPWLRSGGGRGQNPLCLWLSLGPLGAV